MLLVEDSSDDADLILLALRKAGLDPVCQRVETDAALKASLAAGPWDAVLSDHTMPEFGSAAALATVRAVDPNLPFLVVSGTVGEEAAVAMMRAGANDYILKGSLARLAPAVEREVREVENRRAKRAAEQAAEHLAAIVESSIDAIVSENANGRLMSWNRGAERLYGWTAAEAIGRHVSFLVPSDKLAERADIVDRLRAGDRVGSSETVRLHKDGRRIDISLTISPMRDADGRLIGFTKTGQDVRERMRAEAALRASETRYRRLFEAAQDGVLIVDVATRQILDANPFLTNLLGYQHAELVGKELWEIGLFQDIEGNKAAFGTLQEQGYVRYDDHPLATKDGRLIEVEFVGNIYDAGDVHVIQCNIRDVTEQKRSEEALREKKVKLAEAVRLARVGYWNRDLATGKVEWSEMLYEIFGMAPDAFGLKFETFLATVHPDDRQVVSDRIDQAIAVAGSFEHSYRILVSGEVRVIHEVGRVSTLADGTPTRIAGTAQDITEQTRADEALRKSEERYRTLISATSAIVWDCPPSGQFDTHQPGWTAFTGQSVEEHKGWGWLNAIHPDDQEKSARAWAAAVAARSDYFMEHRVRRSDGEYRQMSARAVPITGPSGAIREWVGVHYDVTEQKRAEEGLRESGERLAAALAASGSGTFRWNIVTDALDWDEQLDRLFGLPPGKTARSLDNFVAMVHPDDRAGVVERCMRCKNEGADFAMEFRVVGPDGAVRWLDDRGQTSRGLDGRPAYMTGACVDITERKRADEALRASVGDFRMLAESVPNIVWNTGLDSKCSYLNPQWMNYTGATLEESLGDGWIKSFHPEDRQRAWEAWNVATATGGTYSVEVRLKRADGIYRWWLARCVPYRDAAGNIIKWFGTCTDIDELKRAETERAELFAQLAPNGFSASVA